jgi:AraC-like DNA-binding protein
MTDHTIKTRLLLRPVRSALGTIRLAGVNQGGFGVGMGGNPLRTLNYYAFNYTLNGQGTYRDRHNKPRPVRRGDISLFFPRIPHACGTAPGEFWDELWFEFEGPAFDLMRKTGLLDPAKPVHHTEDCDYWFRRFFQIIPPLHLRQQTPPQVIVARFVSVLTDILANTKTTEDTPAHRESWVDQACQLLTQHDADDADYVAVVAKKLGFSYETFRKKFRAAVGFAPGQFHLDARIDRAAALLHQGKHTVKEIAAQLNFCDEFYFSRCFKRRFGQSPRAFRQRVRGA